MARHARAGWIAGLSTATTAGTAARSPAPFVARHCRRACGVTRARRSAARADRAARGAEVAAVPADDGVVPAFVAERALHRARRSVAARRFEDTHLARRHAALVEDAEHRVAVDHQPREIRDRRRPVLLPPLAGHER